MNFLCANIGNCILEMIVQTVNTFMGVVIFLFLKKPGLLSIMSPVVPTAEGEEKNETQYNLEIAKSSFSICYSYSCKVKSLTVYQNHCPT